jgi:hypothetical protein
VRRERVAVHIEHNGKIGFFGTHLEKAEKCLRKCKNSRLNYPFKVNTNVHWIDHFFHVLIKEIFEYYNYSDFRPRVRICDAVESVMEALNSVYEWLCQSRFENADNHVFHFVNSNSLEETQEMQYALSNLLTTLKLQYFTSFNNHQKEQRIDFIKRIIPVPTEVMKADYGVFKDCLYHNDTPDTIYEEFKKHWKFEDGQADCTEIERVPCIINIDKRVSHIINGLSKLIKETICFVSALVFISRAKSRLGIYYKNAKDYKKNQHFTKEMFISYKKGVDFLMRLCYN